VRGGPPWTRPGSRVRLAAVTLTDGIAIFAAGIGAGMINAVAGGGTLLSFPVLVWAGRDPIVANATNALALWPGALAGALGFRRELAKAPRLLGLLLPPALVGAGVGGWLLLRTPSRLFGEIVPYLVAAATLLLALQRPLRRLTNARDLPAEHVHRGAQAVALVAGQLVVSIYGGYFGAGMGILMLASLGLYGIADIHQRNGLKNVLSAVINGLAGIYFAFSGAIAWADAVVLGLGAVVGGYAGAAVGRKLSRNVAELVVVTIGVGMTIALFFRR
jgi:uncharacterized membrane protein YfcA